MTNSNKNLFSEERVKSFWTQTISNNGYSLALELDSLEPWALNQNTLFQKEDKELFLKIDSFILLAQSKPHLFSSLSLDNELIKKTIESLSLLSFKDSCFAIYLLDSILKGNKHKFFSFILEQQNTVNKEKMTNFSIYILSYRLKFFINIIRYNPITINIQTKR